MSQFTDKDRESIIILVDAICDESIAEKQMTELEGLLSESREARKFYHLQMAIHRDLENSFPEAAPVSEKKIIRFPTSLLALVSALVVSVIGILVWWPNKNNPTQTPVASISSLTETIWNHTSSTLEKGASLQVGDHLAIESGIVQITFPSGVVLSLEGPADLECTGIETTFLHLGKLAAYVPPGAEGFRVLTGNAEVIDQGTEFAINATADEKTQVVVFDGKVDLVTNDGEQRIEAGNAFLIDHKGNARQTGFFSNAFKRTRADLRNNRVIWDAFRTGEPFPGNKSGGWDSEWQIATRHGSINEKLTGITEGNELVMGSESFLQVAATAKESLGNPTSISLTRFFRGTKKVFLDQPYSTEFFVRLDTPGHIIASGSPGWSIDTSSLSLVPGTTYRFAVAIDPESKTWRAIVNERRSATRSRHRFEGGLNSISDPHRASIQIEGIASEPTQNLKFSIDAVRVWNFPFYISQ